MSDCPCNSPEILVNQTAIELAATATTIDVSPIINPIEILGNSQANLEILGQNQVNLEANSPPSATIELLPNASITIIAGSSDILEKSHPLGEDIEAFKIVVLIDGLLYKADTTNPLHSGYVEGITRGSGTTGDRVIVSTDGYIENSAWNWNPTSGNRLFLSTNGDLVEIPDASHAFQIEVATINTSKQITLDIQPPLLLNQSQ